MDRYSVYCPIHNHKHVLSIQVDKYRSDYNHMFLVMGLHKVHKHQCTNSFTCKIPIVQKALPSKVQSDLEVNALTQWQQQDLISECNQGLYFSILNTNTTLETL